MSERQSAYTVPVYPAVVLVSNTPAPCASCGGDVLPDTTASDLEQCTVCGLRRMRPAPGKPAAACRTDAREALAAYAHEAWSGWIRYMFSSGQDIVDGRYVLPVWAVERWTRQMNTPFADLSESEKESDRAEADKMLALLSQRAAAACRDDAREALAAVELHCGRWCLMIGEFVVAMETDPCRDPFLAGSFWNKHTLEQAATRINHAAAASSADTSREG